MLLLQLMSPNESFFIDAYINVRKIFLIPCNHLPLIISNNHPSSTSIFHAELISQTPSDLVEPPSKSSIVEHKLISSLKCFSNVTVCPCLLWSGLDPTIFFYMNGNRSMDLDQSDAHFVDVIHTGAGILGQWGPTGHADFYVNGGSSQPGCATTSILRK